MQLVLNNPNPPPDAAVDDEANAIFIDPVFGTPLAIYVDKDVENRDVIVDTINVG